jgi:hypothetical protein
MSALQARLDSTLDRADSVLRARLKLEVAQLEQAEAEQRRADAAQARADAERKVEIQTRYSDSFAAFNVETPQARDDEPPGAYRRRLFSRLQRKLPDSHELAGIRSDDLGGKAFANFEAMLISAAQQEGERPSWENLPADGSMVERTRVNPVNGVKTTEFFGRRSFIADMGLPSRRVLRLMNPKTGDVLLGPPFSRDPRGGWR